MVALILGMLVCVVLALVVVALVAVPARRSGRGILTPKGEEVVSALKERQQSARQRLERGESDDAPQIEEAAQPASASAPETSEVTPAESRTPVSADTTARR